jgi:hypothetical protein
MLSDVMMSDVKFIVVVLSDVMLIVVVLRDVMLSDIMPSVVLSLC